MADQDNKTTHKENMSRADARALALAEAKERAKAKAKAAKQAYMERPEVKARIAKQKETLRQKAADRRKELSVARKAAIKSAKSALSEAKTQARTRRQAKRDQELHGMLTKASDLPETATTGRPQLTIIHGGRSSES